MSTIDGITPSEFHAADGTQDWRLVGDGAQAFYRTASFAEAAGFVAALADLPGLEAHHPDVDIRHDGVTLRLLTVADDWFGPTRRDVDMAARISDVATRLGLVADPDAVQSLLIVPGAPDPAAILPFWQAALGYVRRLDSPEEDLVDPRDRGTQLWFERMDAPRADGGGTIHVGVWVPPDQAEARVAAALAAGGRLVRDGDAPSWWTLADAAGNEVCISTTRGRD